MSFSRLRCGAGAALLLLAPFAARAAEGPLVLYSAQHEQMVDGLTARFTQSTGIAVKVRTGEAPEIASQIIEEGARSPADVYFTENSPELTLLDEKGLLAAVEPSTLAAVPSSDSAADGHWVGVLARENVLAFNPSRWLPRARCPRRCSILPSPNGRAVWR